MRSIPLVLALLAGPFILSSVIAADGSVMAAPSAIADISVTDLKAAVDAKTVTVLDVNGSKSFSTSHIPGAIDYSANKAELAKLLPTDKTALVVAYCGSEHCGAYKTAADAAVALGYTNVKHLKVGIKGWLDAKMPTEAAVKT